MDKILENFGDMKDGTRPHSFGVFLESVFPIALSEEFIVAKIIEQLVDVFPVNDFSESDVPCVHGRYHDQDVVRTNSQEVESFKLSLDQTIGNFLNYSNPMIRVNDLVANLKLVHMREKAAFIVVAGHWEGQHSIEFPATGNHQI